jgi:hypothetical protein
MQSQTEDQTRKTRQNINNNPGVTTTIQQILPQYDTAPVRRNEAWGASINNLPPTTFRLYFQNINGLQYKMTNYKWQPHLDYMKDKGIYISGLAETNTNWQYRHLKKEVKSNANNIFHNSSVVVSDNSFNRPDRSNYLPGGCLQICTDHWTARIMETYHDPRRMGRWTGQRYRMRNGKTLSIITAYRPCTQNVSDRVTPSITVSHQQKLLYYRDNKHKIDPRELFMKDITKLITTIEKDPKNLCVLMWDANESIDDPTGAVRKLISETTLVDTFAQIAGDPGAIPTYARGKKRIDFILTSQALVPYISRAGYLALKRIIVIIEVCS